jgi:hypothetical protein
VTGVYRVGVLRPEGFMDNYDHFHDCALFAGVLAKHLGKFDDSEFVRKLSYAIFESTKKVIANEKLL